MPTLVLNTDAPLIAGPPQGRWTYADWEALSDDRNRYEIIDGVLYVSTAPSFFHQWISLALAGAIGVPARNQGLAFAAFAPIGVLMPGCGPVQPDFVLVLAERAEIIHDRRIFGIPDLIVEILSASNRDYDLQIKLAAYARAELPECAIVDPEARTLGHYRLALPGRYADPTVYGADDTMRFDCLPALPLRIGELFAGSPDTSL